VFGWRHAPDADPDPALCLPFQLQALFARLACSRCAAVSTKPLTASFGWTAADSFHQHDVQELNRVLFDALARSSTSFADVSRHYTGRMNDYIQDLRWPAEGCVRRAHEEEFMDVQLDVGGGIGTIEEALGRFIEPEIMDGDNKVCPLTAQPIACRRGVGVSCTHRGAGVRSGNATTRAKRWPQRRAWRSSASRRSSRYTSSASCTITRQCGDARSMTRFALALSWT